MATSHTTLPPLPAAFKSTPVLVDGVLYIKTSMSQAVAVEDSPNIGSIRKSN